MLTTGQDTQQLINSAQAQDRYNKNWEIQQAEKQMEFQRNSNREAMNFSATQAQIAREFEERMSNTSHQREIQDLIKAGLNPVLSVNKGASTPTSPTASGVASGGSKGNTDSSMTNLFSGMLQAIINQATALNTTSMNNQTAKDINNATNMTNLQMTALNNKVAQIVANIQKSAALGSASIYAKNNIEVQKMKNDLELYIKENFPQTMVGGAAAFNAKFSKFYESIQQGIQKGLFAPDAKGNDYIQMMIDDLFSNY